MTCTLGSDGSAKRGNRNAAKLTLDDVEDMREEWSRKAELTRISRERMSEAVELSSRLADLEKEAREAMVEALKITQRGLAEQYGVSVMTVRNIVNGDSWVG